MHEPKTPHLTDDERVEVKEALICLIRECRAGGQVGEPASDRLNAAAQAVEALMQL